MPHNIAYMDCFSGASGNMLLGALLDAGLPLEQLQADLDQLHLEGYALKVERQVRKGISGTHFDVDDQLGEHPVRNLPVVSEIINASDLPQSVKERSIAVFTRLAKAEARIHGQDVNEIHFHEIGAVDTLIDIVGVIAGLEHLGVAHVYSSPVPTGGGTVTTQHGLLPVPAPATLAILAEKGAAIIPSEARIEMVTPTGAALLAELAEFRQPPMRISAVGHGFGTKELPWANMLRIWIGEELETAPKPTHGDHGHSHDDHDHGHEHNHKHDERHEHHHES
jgi:pyridinium-3,5-bisthiocarboxylic acid mononucleotide nickel chelatase